MYYFCEHSHKESRCGKKAFFLFLFCRPYTDHQDDRKNSRVWHRQSLSLRYPNRAHRPPTFPRIRACLFDMDGLLLDTEDIYTKCNNIILAEYGRPNLPWKIKAQLQGRPGPEVCFTYTFQIVPSLSTPKPTSDTSLPGGRDLPRLGPSPPPSSCLPRKAARAASALLPDSATPPRHSHAPQESQEQQRATRARHILTCPQLQAQDEI